MEQEPISIEEFLQACEKDGTLLLGAGAPAVCTPVVAGSTVEMLDPTGASRQRKLLISTNTPDRKGHIVNPMGANLDTYRHNPVFMWNHEGYRDPSKIIGKSISVTQHEWYITAVVEYAVLDSNPFVSNLWELECKGLLPAQSIGIRPLAKITRNAAGIVTIGEWELCDISKVAVGMNAQASNLVLPW